MIVSRDGGYIFVHIPKTGGTALTLALEATAGPDDLLIGDTPEARRRRPRLRQRLQGVATAGRVWKHAGLADIEGLVAREDFPCFRVFTLIRNPWERLASLYHWLRVQSFDHPQVQLARARDFAGFLAAPEVATAFGANPSAAYVTDGGGTEHCALWLRHDRLAEDLPRLEALLGRRLPPLPRANASDRPADWRRLYSDDDAARVAAFCAEDIARFGWRFDPGPGG